MVGSRGSEQKASFPRSELAARYGASVEEETEDMGEAYKDSRQLEPGSIGLPLVAGSAHSEARSQR